MSTTTVANSTHPLQAIQDDQFRTAVVQIAATMDKPEHTGRLQKAMDFVLTGAVTINTDGTATVKSGSHTYQIHGECTCADAQHTTKFCKHFLAVELLKRVHLRTGSPRATPNGQKPQEPPAWVSAQAPSSCTLKWAINGIELMLTLRATTDQELFNRIGKVLPRIEEKMATQRQQHQQAQATGGKGNNGRSNTPSPAEREEEDRYCHYHDAPLKKYTKDGRSWYSHQTTNGEWCRGK